MLQNYRAETPLGYQQIAATAALATPTIPAGTTLILVTPEGNACRWRDDGVNPTAAVGYPLAVSGELRYTAATLTALRLIAQTGTTAYNFTYYGG